MVLMAALYFYYEIEAQIQRKCNQLKTKYLLMIDNERRVPFEIENNIESKFHVACIFRY